MRKCIYLSALFLFFLQIGKAQENSIFEEAINNWKNQNKLWTNEQVYTMTAKFQIQDSLFNSPDLLNASYKILSYMPQNDLEIYCRDLQEGWEDLHVWKNYMREIKLINFIDEWVALLKKYPRIASIYLKTEGIGNGNTSEFNEFINKLKLRKKLLFIGEDGSTILVDNTRANFNKFRHLTRLK